LGVGFLVGGYVVRRRGLPVTTQALVGLSIFTLYASAFAALHLYRLWPEQVAFVECAGLTVLAIALALYADSPAVVLLGALGGYLTPILTSSGSGNYVGLFTYLAFLNVALVACAVWRDWRFLKPLALTATALMFVGWLVNSHFDPAENSIVWGTQWFAVLHGLIFLVGSTVPPMAWKRTSQGADLLTMAANSFLFVGLTWILFRDHPDQQLALVSWGMALLHGALFGITYARISNVDRMPRVHLALAAVFFTLAIPMQINNAAYWGATWCVEGLAITAVGVYFCDRQMCTTAAIVLLLGAGRLLGWDFHALPTTIGDSALDLRAVMFLIAGLTTLLSGGLYRLIPWVLGRETDDDAFHRHTAGVLSAVGPALVTLAPVLQLHDWIYLGPIWAVEALAFTVLGLMLRDRQMCITGLLVLALAAIRLVGFDFLSPAQSLGESNIDLRFGMFLFAGVMAMLAGGLYRLLPWAVRQQPLTDEVHRSIASAISALGSLLVILAPILQLHDLTYLGPVWAIEALLLTVLGLAVRDPQMRLTGLLVFLLAGARLIGFDFLSPARALSDSAIDLRSAAFMWVGLWALGCGALYRIVSGMRADGSQQDDVFTIISRDSSNISRDELGTLSAALLLVLGALLVTCSPPLQLSDWALLGPTWAAEALLLTVLGIVFSDRLLSCIGSAVFVVAAVRLIPWDFRAQSRLIAGTSWDLRFVVMELSGLLAIAAGSMYWLIPRLLRRQQPGATEQAVGGLLAGAGNIALMLGLLCQSDSRLVLVLWTLDATVIWAGGFWFDKRAIRWYAAGLALVMVCGRAIHDGSALDGPYQLVVNSRFGSLALVAALFFAAGGIYRKATGGKQKVSEQFLSLFNSKLGELDESVLDPLLGVLANLVLLTAISFEIQSWYAAAIAAGYNPFSDMHMAEMATYSIVWAIYAALIVAAGFALRYPLFRLLGLVAFGLILIKVFFIDLESLRWLPRVLALAVLGLTLMGVSMLYQKFASRMEQNT
jgi:uncharacterized membrane protein